MASSDAEQPPPPPPPPEAPPGPPTPNHLSPTAQPSQENQNGERGPDPPRGRIILVNPLTQYMAVVDPSSPPPSSWEPLVRALRDGKGGGGPPASRESVRAMRDVVMKRTGERGGGGGEEECAICMEELEEGREMPCRHRFHGGCIERWLGIHGTCPVCRYQMPADEGGAARKGWEEDDEGGEGGEEGRDIWISYSVVRRDGSSDTDHHHHHHHLHDRLHRHYSADGA